MGIIHEEIYNRLRGHLIINMRQLDEEVIQLPGLMNESIECEASAMAIRDNAKNRLSFVTSTEQAHLRTVIVYDEKQAIKKRTEGEIKELAEISDQVQEAQVEFEEAKYEYELWRGVTEGLRTKASSLKRLNELTVCGYITPSSFKAEQHAADRAGIASTRRPLKSQEE